MNQLDRFFDSNILLYLLSADPIKADCAERLLSEGATISVQVLNEFASVALRKFKMPWESVRDALATIRALCPAKSLTVETHERALWLAKRYDLSFYDAMVVASALLAGCTTLYSEDMQCGLIIDRQLTICNPFIAE